MTQMRDRSMKLLCNTIPTLMGTMLPIDELNILVVVSSFFNFMFTNCSTNDNIAVRSPLYTTGLYDCGFINPFINMPIVSKGNG